MTTIYRTDYQLYLLGVILKSQRPGTFTLEKSLFIGF